MLSFYKLQSYFSHFFSKKAKIEYNFSNEIGEWNIKMTLPTSNKKYYFFVLKNTNILFQYFIIIIIHLEMNFDTQWFGVKKMLILLKK